MKITSRTELYRARTDCSRLTKGGKVSESFLFEYYGPVDKQEIKMRVGIIAVCMLHSLACPLLDHPFLL